ncbi:hypothetical protein MFUR16E_04515 [Methylobacterium fujisawaense]|uniref:carph-isopro domain-containing protein n=1 Tax=Methylobacterium fujisawaense TaxID=107400 RepID=UPI002F2E2725
MRSDPQIQSVMDLFEALGGTSAVARLLGVGQSTASEMKRRGSIPSEYWVGLVQKAHEAQIVGVTYEVLAFVHAAAKGKLPGGVEAERAAS